LKLKTDDEPAWITWAFFTILAALTFVV